MNRSRSLSLRATHGARQRLPRAIPVLHRTETLGGRTGAGFARCGCQAAGHAGHPTFYRQWRLMGFDGTVMDVPDSEANAEFGRSSGSRGEGAFPQVRKVSLVELGTHVEVAMTIGGSHDR